MVSNRLIPLLATSLFLAIRGSFRGRLLLLGALGYFLYTGATYALGGVAYNQMFLVYVALFSASLFALVLAFSGFDRTQVDSYLSGEMPRRLAGVFLVASGAVTLAILADGAHRLVALREPAEGLETHTTLFTHAFDMAVIVQAAIVPGVMILRRRSFGYVVAFSLLVLEALLMPLITIATIVQVRLGVEFEPGEIIGPIAGFSVFAVFAVWVIVAILRPSSRSDRGGGGPSIVELASAEGREEDIHGGSTWRDALRGQRSVHLERCGLTVIG